MDGEQLPPQEQPVIRTIAMPADTDPAGDIFGGWLMSQMDLAAGNLAARTARGRAATVAVDGMRFHLPVKVGDEVSLFATLTRRGRTSMDIHVTAWRRSRHEEVSQKVPAHLRPRRPERRGGAPEVPRERVRRMVAHQRERPGKCARETLRDAASRVTRTASVCG